jgi:hypothetical protein
MHCLPDAFLLGEDVTPADEHLGPKRIQIVVSFSLEESKLLSRLEEERGINAVQVIRALVREAAQSSTEPAARKR